MVYKAKDNNIGRIAAIKTIKLPDTTVREQEELTKRFKQEAMAAGNLNHPNIVTIYEYDQEDDIAFIAMEFIEGIELKTSLDNNEAFTERHILNIMKQLLAALQYSHQHGVIHRDIKPSNLMITDNDHVKVTDFGIARLESSELTQVGATIGTPSYMSPEQCTGQTVDARSDIFSTGVLLYQLLTGEKPFAGPSITSILHKITQITPPNPSQLNYSISNTFDQVIKKALAKRPGDRYQSAKEFSAALEAIDHPELTEPVDDDATIAVPLQDLESSPLQQQENKAAVNSSLSSMEDDATIAIPVDQLKSYMDHTGDDETIVVNENQLSPDINDATVVFNTSQLEQNIDDATVVVNKTSKSSEADEATIAVPVKKLKRQTIPAQEQSKVAKAKYVIIVPAALLFIVVAVLIIQYLLSPDSPTPVQQQSPPEIISTAQKDTVLQIPPVSPIPDIPTDMETAPQPEKKSLKPHDSATSPSIVQIESTQQPDEIQSHKEEKTEPINVYSYSIRTNPPGAVIEHGVLGVLDSPTPMEVFLKRGAHQLYITKEGYQDISVVIDIDDENSKNLELTLLPQKKHITKR